MFCDALVFWVSGSDLDQETPRLTTTTDDTCPQSLRVWYGWRTGVNHSEPEHARDAAPYQAGRLVDFPRDVCQTDLWSAPVVGSLKGCVGYQGP